MFEFEYRRDGTEFVLIRVDHDLHEEEEVDRMEKVSVGFDAEDWILLKHGRPESVEKWHAKTVKKYTEGGLGDIAQKIKVVTGAFALEDLNRALSTSGAIRLLVERAGIHL